MSTRNTSDGYVGIDKDLNGGMTPAGKMIRDAWVFGLLPENETCTGWPQPRLIALQQQVQAEWDKYGCLASNLPDELRERHMSIHMAAFQKAKEAGWDGDDEMRDDN